MVHNRDAVVHMLVYICDICDVIYGVVVVDVRDLYHAYASVCHVYFLNITRAGVIPRDINFSRSKGEPSNWFCAHANSYGKSSAANECDESRGIDRSDRNWPGNPAPTISRICPTTIVKRRKAPRFIFNPGPSPGRNIGPMTVTIRRPITGHTARLPNISVFRIISPTTVVVEILVAGHILRNVLATTSLVFALIARLRPPAEIIGRLNVRDVVAQLVSA
jgi:hypothetical protein